MKRIFMFYTVLIAMAAHAQTDSGKAKLDEGMGSFYGLGRQYDPVKAFQDFKQSAAQGNSTAMNFLGNMYAGGLTVPQNLETAVKWYEKAGSLGNALAYNNLANFYRSGDMLPQDFTKSASYYKKSAALGNVLAKESLAYYYYKGLGVPQRYTNAFALYYDLANTAAATNANDWYFLGLCYRNGYGTPVNKEAAKKWLQKAAEKGDAMASHELTAEPLPENRSVVSQDLQQKVATIKSHTENFIAQNTNDISGSYQGYAVYYDFSKQFVHDVVPLALDLKQSANGYEGIWTEGDSLAAPIKGWYDNNNLFFDSSSQYTRRNYYSYGSAEKYRFNTAALNMKYFNDSIYLAGDVQFYSITRKEPGQPVYIMLQKKGQGNNMDAAREDFLLTVSPNPASATIKVGFTIYKTEKVELLINGPNGETLMASAGETLPAGSYSYSFNVSGFAAASYMVRLQAGNAVQTKKFIKL